ncbi:MAG TPA: ATP-binding protein [Ruminococcus sp.]|nr:ATP-binding protein [Ruminococcus sp.]
MAKVIMTCGRICSGKSIYAEKLRREMNAVVLSVDELTLALFNNEAGEMHDTYVERAERYFFEKSVQIVQAGIDVILDWGFWTKAERKYAKEFFGSRNIKSELHYIRIDDALWKERITCRNSLVKAGKISAYYVDEELLRKFALIFEEPEEYEINKIIS